MKNTIVKIVSVFAIAGLVFASCNKSNPDPKTHESAQDQPVDQRTDIVDDYVYIDDALSSAIQMINPLKVKPVLDLFTEMNGTISGSEDNSLEGLIEENCVSKDGDKYLVDFTGLYGKVTYDRELDKMTFEPGGDKFQFLYTDSEGVLNTISISYSEPIKALDYARNFVSGLGDNNEALATVLIPTKYQASLLHGSETWASADLALSLSGIKEPLDFTDSSDGLIAALDKSNITLSGTVSVMDYNLVLDNVNADINYSGKIIKLKGSHALKENSNLILSFNIDNVTISETDPELGLVFDGTVSAVTTDKLCLAVKANKFLANTFKYIASEFATKEEAQAASEIINETLGMNIYYGNAIYQKCNAVVENGVISDADFAELVGDGYAPAYEDGWRTLLFYSFGSDGFQAKNPIHAGLMQDPVFLGKFSKTMNAISTLQSQIQQMAPENER